MARFLGYPYPITKTPKGYFYTQEGVNTIKADLLQLLLTNPGERVMEPEYGTPLKNIIFEPNDYAARIEVRNMILDSIARWEPRIVVQAIEVSSEIDKNSLNKFDDRSQIENILFVKIIFVDPEQIREIQELVLEVPMGGGL